MEPVAYYPFTPAPFYPTFQQPWLPAYPSPTPVFQNPVFPPSFDTPVAVQRPVPTSISPPKPPAKESHWVGYVVAGVAALGGLWAWLKAPTTSQTHQTESNKTAKTEPKLGSDLPVVPSDELSESERHDLETLLVEQQKKFNMTVDETAKFMGDVLKVLTHKREPMPQADLKSLAQFSKYLYPKEIYEAFHTAFQHPSVFHASQYSHLLSHIHQAQSKLEKQLDQPLTKENANACMRVLKQKETLTQLQRVRLIQIEINYVYPLTPHTLEDEDYRALAMFTEEMPTRQVRMICSNAKLHAEGEKRALSTRDLMESLQKKQREQERIEDLLRPQPIPPEKQGMQQIMKMTYRDDKPVRS